MLVAKNQDSCVLLVSIGHFRWLLTGDSGAIQEREWSENVGQVDFLQVPIMEVKPAVVKLVATNQAKGSHYF